MKRIPWIIAGMKPAQAAGMGRIDGKGLQHGLEGGHGDKNQQKPGSQAMHWRCQQE
jgi:hypothetical protein